MSGLKSRRKGRTGEYGLRDHMRSLGYEAIRVPLSGASEGYKGDVVAWKPGQPQVTFELKCRKDTFKAIYALLDTLKVEDSLNISMQDGTLVSICRSFPTEARTVTYTHDYLILQALPSCVRTLGKIKNLRKLLGGADWLVIKDDRKPLLFIHYV
jgi:hypothetical protein